jgi:NitT/TauT family transport system ATP-binding protein
MALVQLAQVSKVYRSLQGSDYVAVRDFSLEIEAGEFFCLLGTSGCGKTTVLNMVAGFEPVSAGDIRIAGRPIAGPAADRGVVFQGDDSLYGWLSRWAMSSSACACAASRGRARAEGAPLSRAGRAARPGPQAPVRAVGRHEAAHPDRPRAGQRAADAADGRAVRRARRPYPRRHAARAEAHLRRHRKTVLFITHDIDEAIILADRIGVMHAGPASKLKGIVPVTLSESERERTHDRFVAVYRQVHEMIRDEVAISLKRAH